MKLLKTTARWLLGSGKLRTGPLARRRIEVAETTVQTSSDPLSVLNYENVHEMLSAPPILLPELSQELMR
jgi:hypothetical protein